MACLRLMIQFFWFSILENLFLGKDLSLSLNASMISSKLTTGCALLVVLDLVGRDERLFSLGVVVSMCSRRPICVIVSVGVGSSSRGDGRDGDEGEEVLRWRRRSRSFVCFVSWSLNCV